MKILFQGDSITDMGRKYEDAHDLGFGYPKYAAELIAKRHPEMDFEFLDLGISGNKVSDLIARLQKDFIDTEADIVSVLIGVNDTWHRANDRNWLDNKTFEAQLREVYGAIKEKMGAKLIVLEQFLIPSEVRIGSGRILIRRFRWSAHLHANMPMFSSPWTDCLRRRISGTIPFGSRRTEFIPRPTARNLSAVCMRTRSISC